MNSRKGEICDVDVHRASYAKHLRSETQMESEIIFQKWLYKEAVDNKIKKI